MATIHEINAEPRKDMGKGASRRLRRAGKVPAILYGAQANPQNIELKHLDTLNYAKHEWFFSAILDLKLEGATQRVLLRDMQRHPFKPEIMHIDFQRVNENEAIRIRVPLHFLNQEKSPAGKTSGVVISHAMTDVFISCLPRDLPEFIPVDLVELKVGDIVHMSDLKLPQGVTIPELKLGKEHDHAVATAQEVKIEVEPVVAEAAVVAEGAPVAGAVPAIAQKAPPGAPGAAPAAPAKDEKKK